MTSCNIRTQEEFPSKSIHTEHGEDIGRYGGGDSDERLHEDVGVYVRVAERLRGVRAALHHVRRRLADVRRRVVVGARPLVETVEHLREPHHQTVVAVETSTDIIQTNL